MFDVFLMNIRLVWSLCIHDKRLRASVIAFILPNFWLGLIMLFFTTKKMFLFLFLIYFVLLLLVAYFFSDRQQYKVSFL